MTDEPKPKWKICRKCKRLLAVEEFYLLGGVRRHSYCKRCANDRSNYLHMLARKARREKQT